MTFKNYKHPTLEAMQNTPPPRRFSEFDDPTLALMASQGVHGAFKERMMREIMRRDHIEYGEAYKVLAEMNKVHICVGQMLNRMSSKAK